MNDYFKDLLTYEKGALDELICTLETVDDSQKVGKISLMLSHILLAQEVWIKRLERTIVNHSVRVNIPIDEMKVILESNFMRLMKFVDENKEDLKIDYKNLKGELYTNTVSDIMSHLAFHSAYHRGQLVLLLKETGITLPDTDYIVFCRKNK